MSRRILIVESDEATAGKLRRVVFKAGYEVLASLAQGDEAIRQAFSLLPDLILIDLQLDGAVDAFDCARQIRVICSRPIIFVAKTPGPAALARARECEPYGFVLRPIRDADLLAQIELALHRHDLETHRAELRRELDLAHENVRKLKGLLPLCAGCKKIQDEQGAWYSFEEYLARYANIEVTHSFCPECETRLYGTKSRAPFVRGQSRSPTT